MYELTLAANYLKHWTVEDAVRELCQNGIDNSEDDKLDYTISDGVLTISTEGVSLHPSVLLLGSGDKSEDDTKLGGFGEGMKVALLILARENIEVVMENGDKLWKPVFRHNDSFGCDMLCIEETENLNEAFGIRFTIKGLTNTELENIVSRTLQTQVYEKVSTEFGEVLLDEDKAGSIFVGGLYVCKDAGLKYGYNFRKGLLPLNRDRQTVPNWEVSAFTDKMLAEALTPEDYIDLVENSYKDVYHAKYNYPKDSVATVAYEKFVDKYGVCAVASSEEDAKKLKKQGYTKVRIETNEGIKRLVTLAPNYTKGEKEEILSLEDKVRLVFENSELRTLIDLLDARDELLDSFNDLLDKVLEEI